jgi:RND family efflux transporter MFP subunit
MRKILPFAGAALLLLVACGDKVKPGSAEIKRQEVKGVAIESVPLVEVDSLYETTGTIKAHTVSVISARTVGTVISVKVREGDRVKAGQELVVLDDSDMAQRVAAAEAGNREALKAMEEARQNRQLADITYQRYKNLAVEKIVTGQEMDQIETQKKVADLGYERAAESAKRAGAQLEEARITRGYTRITAPHNGVITERKIDPGSLAMPGSPLLVLEDTSRFKVEAHVDSRLAGRVTTGLPVKMAFAGADKEVAGTIGEVTPAVDPRTRSFLVKIYLDDPSLRSGLYTKVSIPEGRKQALLVPANAVVAKGQLTGVYAVDEKNVMTYRIVRTGQSRGSKVEIISGLSSGERIAINGLEKCVDGGIVK